MNKDIRALFPAVTCSTYLNSAAMAPLPTMSVRAVTSQLEDVASNGNAHLSEWSATKSRCRLLTATMLGVKPEGIAFMRNTSDGLGSVAAGMNWEQGDNIVTIAGEFPANYYPWRKLSDDHGVELRFCREADGRIDHAELCGLIDSRTKVVAASAVQYADGFRLDLERVGRVARSHDALFCVDIIQAFGAMPLDIDAHFVDVAAGASYKWLCAPEGCGIFYVSERARERVKPTSRGWSSVAKPWNFDNLDQPMVADSRVWETGMGGSALFYGLEQSLRLLYETGIERIAAYLAELTDFLCEIIPSTRYRIVSSRIPGERSQIVSVAPINGLTSREVERSLASEKIFVSARGPLVRIAPHFFNNIADIERLVEGLP